MSHSSFGPKRPTRRSAVAGVFLLALLMSGVIASTSTSIRKTREVASRAPRESHPSRQSPAGASPKSSESGPSVWLQESQPLAVTHVDATGKRRSLAAAGAQPLSLVSGDFDEDGVEDLVVGYGTQAGGLIAVHRGNLDAFAPQSHESWQATAEGRFPSPFLREARVFDIPVKPDFVASGNFTGHDDLDLVAASRDSNLLYVLAGDGKGGFRDPQPITLPGNVTALAAGNLGRGKPFSDLIVGVTGTRGSSVVVYSGTLQGADSGGQPAIKGSGVDDCFGRPGRGRPE